MKQALVGVLLAILSGIAVAQTAIINEWSQGTTGSTKEWIEILVVQDHLNMQNWTLRDGGGSGTITFTGAMWADVPAGGLIVIFNGADRDPALPANDSTFGANYTVVLPGNTAGLFTQTAWMNLSNSAVADNPILSDASAVIVHDWDQTDNTAFTSLIKRPGSNSFVYYTGNTVTGVSDSTNWTKTTYAVGSPTPGSGNVAANNNWIASLRNQVSPPAITAVSRDIQSPGANTSVAVSATVSGLNAGTVTLQYRVLPTTAYTPVVMTLNGGSYTASIPGQAEGSTVTYYVDAVNPGSSTVRFPASADQYYRAQTGSLADRSLVINEIQYLPAANHTDWFELYNTTASAIDLSYFQVQDNQTRQYVLPFGMTLPAGGYMVLAQDSTVFRTSNPSFTALLAPSFGFGLDDLGDQIRVFDANGNALDSVSFSASGAWPVVAAGTTIELVNALLENNLGDNWHGSQTLYGTPGAVNSGGDIVPPVLNSASASSRLRVLAGFNEPVGAASASTFSNFTIAGVTIDSTVRQTNNTQVLIYINPATPLTANLQYTLSVNNIADLTGNTSGVMSLQFTYVPLPQPAILISEIMFNPRTPGDPQGEWVELYNSTNAPINLNGWRIQDNSATIDTIDIDLIVPSHGYTVLAYNPDTLATHGITANFRYATGIQLSNTSDRIVIRNAAGVTVDSITYLTSGAWPASLDGSSISVADLEGDRTVGSTWAYSPVTMSNGDQGTPGLPHTGAVAAPGIAVRPTSYDFGTVPTTAVYTASFWVRNTGNAVLPITNVHTGFDQSANWSTANIAAGDSLELILTWSPTTAYTLTDTVRIVWSAPANTILDIPVTGISFVPTPPDAPTGLTITRTTDDVTLSWSAVTGATGYKVYWATLATDTWQYLGTTASTTYTETGVVSASQRKLYRITAVNPY